MTVEPDDQLTPDERELEHPLLDTRPLPSAGFRGALGRYLAQRDPGYGPRPERLRLVVTGWLLLGLILISLGAIFGVGAL